jgi:hypothetical protein
MGIHDDWMIWGYPHDLGSLWEMDWEILMIGIWICSLSMIVCLFVQWEIHYYDWGID